MLFSVSVCLWVKLISFWNLRWMSLIRLWNCKVFAVCVLNSVFIFGVDKVYWHGKPSILSKMYMFDLILFFAIGEKQ